MKKQYIILDNNSHGPRAVHAALAYAEACRFTDFADVKLVVTPMLRAELDRSHELHMKHFKENYDQKKTNDLSDITLAELLDAYSDYTVQPPPSPIELRVQDEITQQLSHIYKLNMHKFYDIIDTPLSIINPEKELPQMMTEDPAFFSQAFNACMKLPAFRDKMLKLELNKNLADKSIVAWYKDNAHKEPNVDILLGSTDRELVKGIKIAHERAPGTPVDGTGDNLFHFDQQGLARHLRNELAKIPVPSKEEDYSTHLSLQTAKELCRIVIYTRGVERAADKNGRASQGLK